MATNIEALQTAWEAEIAKISDALIAAEATVALDRYIGAITQQQALEAGNIDSYTIAGRSVTRRNVGEGREAINALRAELFAMCRGADSLLDLNTEVSEP